MVNLQDDTDDVHHSSADGKSFLTSDTGVRIPDGTHPSNYSKGKKCNDMHASTSDGIVSVNR
jgi:hypothetical protein